MKKLLSILLFVSLVIFSLAACAKTPEELLEKAEEALKEESFSAEISMRFSSSDPTISEFVSAIPEIEYEMECDGDNMRMIIDMDMEEVDLEIALTVVGNTAYMKGSVEMGSQGQTMKYKATVTEEEAEELFGTTNATGDISPLNFKNITLEEKDGEKIIICTDPNDEAMSEINDLLGSSLGEEVEAEIKNVKFVHELDDGRYDESKLSFDVVMEIMGEEYTMSAVLEIDFDFDKQVDVSAPTDADKYEEIDYEELLGSGFFG